LSNISWSDYAKAYEEIHKKLDEILTKLDSVGISGEVNVDEMFSDSADVQKKALVDADRHVQIDVLSSVLPSGAMPASGGTVGLEASTNVIGYVNPAVEPHGSRVYLGGTSAPVAAGEVTIDSETPASGVKRYIMEVIGGGNINGYVTIYWGATVKWRGRFIANTSVGEQFKVPIEITGDGTTVLSLKVYASGAGDIEAFLNAIGSTG